MKKYLPKAFYNPISIIGFFVAIISLILIIFSIIVELLSENTSPYMGIISFIIMPTLFFLGLFAAFFGLYLEHRKKVKGKAQVSELPKIDFNIPRHRKNFVVIILSTIVFLLLSAYGSFKAYEYTDSDEFCGTLCHEVMHPEYTAYLNSPHAHVGCVQCHIGSGADWFVRAKLSGVGQVYMTLMNKYHKPIETPIANLRPAEETCEQCHWPKHFYEDRKVHYDYILSDENNSQYSLTMIIDIGGENNEYNAQEGIHAKMFIANKISYYSTDPKRQVVEVVKSKSTITGKEKIFRLKDFKDPIDNITFKKIDCIECHNRPSHIYRNPDFVINKLISRNLIDKTIPFINSVTVQAVQKEYKDSIDAKNGIKDFLFSYYKNNYPQIYNEKNKELNNINDIIYKVYSRNIFPEMKVSWKYYPNHIGHLTSQGCFACHDGNHFDEEGNTISRDCNLCHKIIEQNTPLKRETNVDGLAYLHPIDIGPELSSVNCTNCHK